MNSNVVSSEPSLKPENGLVNVAMERLKQEQLRRDVNAGISQSERGEDAPLDIEYLKLRGRAALFKDQTISGYCYGAKSSVTGFH